MLVEIIRAFKISPAVPAMKVLIVPVLLLVQVSSVLATKSGTTGLTSIRVGVVTFLPHVLFDLPIGNSTSATGFALVRPDPVVYSGHVLLTSLPGVETPSAAITLESQGRSVEGSHMSFDRNLVMKPAIIRATLS